MLAKNWIKCFPEKNPVKSRGKSGKINGGLRAAKLEGPAGKGAVEAGGASRQGRCGSWRGQQARALWKLEGPAH